MEFSDPLDEMLAQTPLPALSISILKGFLLCFVRFLGRMRCIRDSQVFSSEDTKLIGYEKPAKETKSNDEKSKKIKF